MRSKSPSRPGREREALLLATKAHAGQTRASGEPYISHPVAVADILRGIGADEDTICAALLHDTVEDTPVTIGQIRQQFGPDVAKLVDGVTKVESLEESLSTGQRNSASIRKIFRAMGTDIRVILIKLADRLHNVRTLGALRKEKQERIALETRDIYCPIAELLSLRDWRDELDDRVFRILSSTEYEAMERSRRATQKRVPSLRRWAKRLQDFLAASGGSNVHTALHALPLRSVYDGTGAQTQLLEHVETFFCVRITVPTEEDCYRTLGIVHQFVPVVPQGFIDFIANPLPNGYQALHTQLLSSQGVPVVVTVQSLDMHAQSERGAALIFSQPKTRGHHSLPWLRTLLSLQAHPRFLEVVQREVFGDSCRVHLVGLRQNTLDVPAHATLLDVAYSLRKPLGSVIHSAVVNGTEQPLKYSVQDGDVVEFFTDAKAHRTATELLFTTTSQGRDRLLKELKSLPAKRAVTEGREYLGRILDLSIDPFFSMDWRQRVQRRCTSNEEALLQIGRGQTNPFDLLEETCETRDLYLLSPQCFQVKSHLAPENKMRYVLQTDLHTLRTGKMIGVQVRPDLIEVRAAGDATPRQHISRELVPLQASNPAELDYPFVFVLRWNFQETGNPLTIISHLQHLLDTPVQLLEFQQLSVAIAFRTNTLQTLRMSCEYLWSQPGVQDVVRISP